MIKSMTGFGKAEAEKDGLKVITEIKSLNGKGLEMSFRMPRQIQHREIEVREFIKKSISRGSISISIAVENEIINQQFSINQDVAKQILDELNATKKKLKLKDAVELEDILVFSQQLTAQQSSDFDENIVIKLLNDTLRQAMKQVEAMKVKEGQNITKDIVKRMHNIVEIVKRIEDLSNNRIPQERERLRQRVAQLFESDEIDEHRLQMEIVLLADKLDVSEECVRLHSHFDFFEETIRAKDSAGRKINFLLQEILREINTIGSKCNDATISQYVVNVKEELERVREQIQNAE